ncbi:hypothetical protein Tco_1412356, partial [Tanacetum coccineum]
VTLKRLATVDLNGMINLKKKLQALKIVIKQSTKNAKKISYKAKISIQSKLYDIDKILDQGGSNEVILSNRSLLLKELNDINSIESLEAAKKSKVHWAIEAIRGTLVDGEWIIDPLAIITDLERNISNEEITSAVWDCETNKSPGPDGFTFEFFRRYRKLLEHDTVAAVKNFFALGTFPLGFNSSFIDLIPMIHDAKFVKDYHSISLIGSLYKVMLEIQKSVGHFESR